MHKTDSEYVYGSLFCNDKKVWCQLKHHHTIATWECKWMSMSIYQDTVWPVLSGHSKRTPKRAAFKTDNRLMQVKVIAECSKGSILQYFWPSLSYHLSLRPLFCLFLSGRLKQVLLYHSNIKKKSQYSEYMILAQLSLRFCCTFLIIWYRL